MFTTLRSVKRCQSPLLLFVMLLALAMGLLATEARAATFDFTPLGTQNSFETSTNWNPIGPPGALDTARFNVASTYEVFFGTSPTNNELLVSRSNVTFRSLGQPNIPVGVIYTLTGGAVIEGSSILFGETAEMTLTSLFNDTMLLKAARIQIGNTGGTFGRLTVTGTGTSLQSDGELLVGRFGQGFLTIENGGSVSADDVTIGAAIFGGGPAQGFITVRSGSTLNANGFLFVGDVGTNRPAQLATLNIEPGASVNILDSTFGTRIGSNGRLNLLGGTLSTFLLSEAGGSVKGDFNWESGTVKLTDPAGFTLGTGVYEFANETLALDANKSFGVAGNLTIPGSGALSMLGGNLNTGSTEVQNGGRLYLLGGSHDFGSGLTNNSSVVVDSTTITGPVTSPAGSTITVLGDVIFNGLVSGAAGFFGPGTAIFNGGHEPGDSPAVVPVEGSLIYGSVNTLTIELAGLLPGEFDRLEILGDATLGGNLVVDLLTGLPLSSNNEFEILDVAGTLRGQFIGLDEGALVGNFGGEDLFISYAAGDGNDVSLFTAVPEPATMVLALLGLGSLVVGHRSRRCQRASDLTPVNRANVFERIHAGRSPERIFSDVSETLSR